MATTPLRTKIYTPEITGDVRVKTNTQPLTDKISTLMDTRLARISFGRIDSTASLIITIGALALQSLKLVAKFFTVAFTLDAFKFVEGCENWSSLGLKLDAHEWTRIGLDNWETFKSIIIAPSEGYESTPTKTARLFEAVIGGTYHDDVFSSDDLLESDKRDVETRHQTALNELNGAVTIAAKSLEDIRDANRAATDAKRAEVNARGVVLNAKWVLKKALLDAKGKSTNNIARDDGVDALLSLIPQKNNENDINKSADELIEAAKKLELKADELSREVTTCSQKSIKIRRAAIKLARTDAKLLRAKASLAQANDQLKSAINKNCKTAVNAINTVTTDSQAPAVADIKTLLISVRNELNQDTLDERKIKLALLKCKAVLIDAYNKASIQMRLRIVNERIDDHINGEALRQQMQLGANYDGRGTPFEGKDTSIEDSGDQGRTFIGIGASEEEIIAAKIPDKIDDINQIPPWLLPHLIKEGRFDCAESILGFSKKHVFFPGLDFEPITKRFYLQLLQQEQDRVNAGKETMGNDDTLGSDSPDGSSSPTNSTGNEETVFQGSEFDGSPRLSQTNQTNNGTQTSTFSQNPNEDKVAYLLKKIKLWEYEELSSGTEYIDIKGVQRHPLLTNKLHMDENKHYLTTDDYRQLQGKGIINDNLVPRTKY